MNSDELFAKSKKLVPGGVHSPVRSFKGLHTTPRFMKKADGAFIYDEENNEYIDFCMSFGPLICGHRDPEVEQAVKESLNDGWTYGACERYSLELADYIINKIDHIEQIRFVNSGTEAVMSAIRIARGYSGKNKIIKFNGCYHGHVDSMLIKAGSGLAGTTEASSSGVPSEISDATLICELGDLGKLEEIIKAHDDIAALFIEPLPANNGLLIQTQEYLEGVRKLCTENDILLVFDEVISGFRTAFGGMAQITGIKPDIVTYGKIIGGGFPVGAVASSEKIMSCLAPVGNVYQAGTLSANPTAMRSGLAALKKLTPDFYEQLEITSQKVISTFNAWLEQSEFSDYQIVNFKSLFWFVPKKGKLKDINDIPDNLSEKFVKLFKHMLDRGIYLSPNGYEIGFISSAHSGQVIEELNKRLWS